MRLDQGRGLARAELLLGLAGELRIADLDRQHVAGSVPDVLGRELHAARQQVAELAELAHRLDHAGAQAIDVRAAAGGRDQVDVALGDQRLGIARPGERPLHHVLVRHVPPGDRLRRHAIGGPELLHQVGAQIAGVEPLLLLAGLLVVKAHAQARAQHRLGLEHALDIRHREAVGIEELRIRPEAHRGAGVALPDAADHLELGMHATVAKADVVFLAAAPHPALQVLRQRVDHRDADAVQAAGEFIGAFGELAAGMQAREDQFDAADLLLRMDVDRHAASVIDHLERVVLVERDADRLAVAGDRLIDAVVDDFVRQVIRARGVGVHAGPAAHRVQATQDFDVGGSVRLSHCFPGQDDDDARRRPCERRGF